MQNLLEQQLERSSKQNMQAGQGDLADVWKENTLEDLEERVLEYKNVREFLVDIKKEFGGENEESAKVAELRKLE